MTQENYNQSINSAAVNLLIKLKDELYHKSEIIERSRTDENSTLYFTLLLERELLGRNIDDLRKMIETQKFDY